MESEDPNTFPQSQDSVNVQNGNIFSHTPIPQTTRPMQLPNQFAHLPYNFNAISVPYPSYANHSLTHAFPYQGLVDDLNNPFNYRTTRTSKGPNNKNKVTQKLSNSQTLLGNKNWTKAEDIALTKAWLHVSVDSDIGNNQKGTTMWERIFQIWRENLGMEDCNSRNSNSLGCRWGKIQAAVNKFHGCYERLERHPQSGTTPEDMKRESLRTFEQVNGQEFKFEHCWELMMKNPKWCSKGLTKTNEPKKFHSTPLSSTLNESLPNEGDEPITKSNASEGINEDGILRPEGRKACKDKKRKLKEEIVVVEVLNNFQNTLDKQLTMHREELSMHREELELKKEKEKRDSKFRDKMLEQEMELKKNALKMKQQNLIMNQDLTKLSPSLRTKYELKQAEIFKEWEECGLIPK